MPRVTYHHPTSREIVAELLDRVQRVDAAAETVNSLTAMHSVSPVLLTDALQALERQLTLATRAAEQARERLRP
jgi:hypothetical protein